MVESLKNYFLRFINGRLGLAATFWLWGVLTALNLNFLTSRATELWQATLLALISLAHLILIVIAVWNASRLYQGWSLWKWIARVAILFSIFKWMLYAPLVNVSILNGFGIQIHSDKYWELDGRNLICKPSEYQRTPEALAISYQCKSTFNQKKNLILVKCDNKNETGTFLFSKTESGCQENLDKLKLYIIERKSDLKIR